MNIVLSCEFGVFGFRYVFWIVIVFSWYEFYVNLVGFGVEIWGKNFFFYFSQIECFGKGS